MNSELAAHNISGTRLPPWSDLLALYPRSMQETLSSWASRACQLHVSVVCSSRISSNSVHGSAPDIAGQDIANPIASIRSAALMLRRLGYVQGADRIDKATDEVIREGSILTPDLGGKSKTHEVTEAILKRL